MCRKGGNAIVGYGNICPGLWVVCSKYWALSRRVCTWGLRWNNLYRTFDSLCSRHCWHGPWGTCCSLYKRMLGFVGCAHSRNNTRTGRLHRCLEVSRRCQQIQQAQEMPPSFFHWCNSILNYPSKREYPPSVMVLWFFFKVLYRTLVFVSVVIPRRMRESANCVPILPVLP